MWFPRSQRLHLHTLTILALTELHPAKHNQFRVRQEIAVLGFNSGKYQYFLSNQLNTHLYT